VLHVRHHRQSQGRAILAPFDGTIDADGFMQITDRSKDVIKSGGERIGTIDLENVAMAHPAVMQAACIGVAHPKWDERPLLVVVLRPGHEVSREALLAHFTGKVAKLSGFDRRSKTRATASLAPSNEPDVRTLW
jgi:acyl-coenzyme A synthetase/AMP-(fatty) acid ligase